MRRPSALQTEGTEMVEKNGKGRLWLESGCAGRRLGIKSSPNHRAWGRPGIEPLWACASFAALQLWQLPSFSGIMTL